MKMYTSTFGQLLISRYDFQKAVTQYDAEKHSKGFSSWNHFKALLFGRPARCIARSRNRVSFTREETLSSRYPFHKKVDTLLCKSSPQVQCVSKSVRSDFEGFGHQWWIDSGGLIMALGCAGQYLIIDQENNMVTVMLSTLPDREFFFPALIYSGFISSACTDKTLPSRTGNSNEQQAMVIRSQDVPDEQYPLPPIAREIIGRTFRVEQNRGRDGTLIFYFSEKESSIIMPQDTGPPKIAIGMNGKFLYTKTEYGIEAARGTWKDEYTFFIERDVVGSTERSSMTITFSYEQGIYHFEAFYRHYSGQRDIIKGTEIRN